MATIDFLGAARTVTGSKFVVTAGGTRVVIDCGLFQGPKVLRERNWQPLAIDPGSLDAVILTHAHIDHTGFLPRLVAQGFSRRVLATHGTAELCRILLPDSARLQEEDADIANRRGFSKHRPALPLYTEAQAMRALELLQSVDFEHDVTLSPSMAVRFSIAGHILGSSIVNLTVTDDAGPRIIAFSGDLGRYDVPILEDPAPVPEADYVVVESTYGDRRHDGEDPKVKLAEIINRTAARGGRVIIPAFAVGRTQEVLYHLRELEEAERIPVLPVMVDSPMAERTTREYVEHEGDHDAEMRRLIEKHVNPLATRRFSFGGRRGGKQRQDAGPAIVISASGMATGGRVLGHLEACLPDARHTVLFVGYQSAGTRGRRLLDGEKSVKIRGQWVPVNAEITSISSLSAHADYEEVLRWLASLRRPPRGVFVVHGEPDAALAMARRIGERFGWHVAVPSLGDRVELTGDPGTRTSGE